MPQRALVYAGTLVLGEFDVDDCRRKDFIAERTVFFDLDEIMAQPRTALHVPQQSSWVDSSKSLPSLRQVEKLATAAEERRLIRQLRTVCEETVPSAKKLIKAFHKTKVALVVPRESHRLARDCAMKEICRRKKTLKKIARLHRLTRMLHLVAREHRTVAQAAKIMCISLNSATHLQRTLKTAGTQLLADLRREIEADLVRKLKTDEYISKRKRDPLFLATTLHSNYDDMRDSDAILGDVSFGDFYSAFTGAGLKHRPIKYVQPIAFPVSGAHVTCFARVYAFVLLNPRKFDLVFVDESSVCKANYKAKQWQQRGTLNEIRSHVRHEKLTIFGAMDRHKILAAQFVSSGKGAQVFQNFVFHLIRLHSIGRTAKRQLVIFLDNCPTHRGTDLKALSQRTGVVFLFNLPHRCSLNPIEFAWEFVKRPLRHRTDRAR